MSRKKLKDRSMEDKAEYVWYDSSPMVRDIILTHSDLDMIDTKKAWSRLDDMAKQLWMNWLFRGKTS